MVLGFESSFCIGTLSFHNLLTFAHLYELSNRKDQKKVTKLEAQIPYHEGRGNKDEVIKIKEQIADIWEKARAAALE
jgi:hypothetical protein